MMHMVSLSSAEWEVTPYSGTKGCYAAVQPDTVSLFRLIDLCVRLGIVSDPRKFHCTLMYSKSKAPELPGLSVTASAICRSVELFEGHDGRCYLVAIMDSPELHSIHASLVKAGAEHSYEKYNPHVTLFSGLERSESLADSINSVNAALSYDPLMLYFDKSVLSDIKD